MYAGDRNVRLNAVERVFCDAAQESFLHSEGEACLAPAPTDSPFVRASTAQPTSGSHMASLRRQRRETLRSPVAYDQRPRTHAHPTRSTKKFHNAATMCHANALRLSASSHRTPDAVDPDLAQRNPSSLHRDPAQVITRRVRLDALRDTPVAP